MVMRHSLSSIDYYDTHSAQGMAFQCLLRDAKPDENHVHVRPIGNRRFMLTVNGSEEFEVLILGYSFSENSDNSSAKLNLSIAGTRRELIITRKIGNDLAILLNGLHEKITIRKDYGFSRHSSLQHESTQQSDWKLLSAPMPSVVTDILVQPETLLEPEQPVIRIEAMKMVITLSAPRACVVDSILVEEQQTVTKDQRLIEFRQSNIE